MKTKNIFSLGLLTAFLFGTAPGLFAGPCLNWNAAGYWKLKQSNGATTEMHLDQKGATFTGRAQSGTPAGDVVGQLGAASLNFQIKWPSFTSLYVGTIAPDGTIKGTAWDLQKPSAKITWSGDRPMTCAEAPAGPKPTPKPAATPVAPTPAPVATPNPTAPPQTVPWITASPRVVTIPDGQTEGKTTLTWDGGPDHPYAEIWVKVDDQDDKKVVEQGKGTRQMTVRPGKTYLYILTDASQTLSTVTVKTQ